MKIRGRGTKRGRGRGFTYSPKPVLGNGHGRGKVCSDPPQPSQSGSSPTPPQPSLFSPDQALLKKLVKFGKYAEFWSQSQNLNNCVKDGKNEGKKKGPVKGLEALKNRQEFLAFISEEDDECYDFDDDEDEAEVEEMQFTGKQAADAVHAEKGMGATSAVSNSNMGNVENANGGKKGGPLDPVPCSTDPPTNGSTSQPSSGRSHVEADRRKVIYVEPVSDPRRFLPQIVTRDIISTVITRMPTPTEKWKNYLVTMKDELFKDFMDRYRFASEYDRNMARTVWDRTCMDRYPDFLKNARKLALKHVNSTNLADTKGRGPKGMKTKIWDGLVDIWLKPEWTKKSDACRSNRAVLPDALLHTGGSISFGEHKRRMEAELKMPVSFRDVYDRVHKKKDGAYISQRSKNFVESYDVAMLKKYGEDFSMHPMIDLEVWAEISGSKKKRKIIGGSSLDIGNHESSSSYPRAPTKEDITEAVNAAMSSFVQTQLVPILEPILKVVSSLQASLQHGVVDK